MKKVKMERGGVDDRLTNFETESGFQVKEVYRPEDIGDINYDRDLGDPGCFPYTRGKFPNGYRERLWVRHQNIGYGTAEDTNEAWKFLISGGGITGIEIPPDKASNVGFDPDHPLAKFDPGVTGPAQYSIEEIKKILDGIAIEGGVFNLVGHTLSSVPVYGMIVAMCQEQGIDLSILRGSMLSDCLTQYAEPYMAFQPFDLMWRFQVDSIEYCTKYTPNFHAVFVSGYALRQSGANTPMELALMLAERMAYIDAALSRGVAFDDVSSTLAMELCSEPDFFETVCKIRTLRRMWARIAKEKYGASEDSRGAKCTISVSGSGYSTRAQQPILNACRTAIEVLACVLGGAQAIQARPYDEPLCLPTKESFLLAGQIQHLIAHETGAALVADPLGGSYYVESFTNEIEEETKKFMGKIEENGGIVEAIKKGWIQGVLRDAVINRELGVLEGKRIITGVNALRVPKELEVKVPIFKQRSQSGTAKQIVEECRKFKESRDKIGVKQALKILYHETQKGKNIMPSMIEALKSHATQGEVVGVVNEGMGYKYDPFDMVKRPDFLSYD